MMKTCRFIVSRTERNGRKHDLILKYAFLLACFLLSVFFFSCAGGAGGSGGDGAEGASLAIHLPETSRAVDNKYAKEDIVSFTVTISSGSFNSTKTANKGETMTFSNLSAGDYSVKAYGKTAIGAVAANCETSVKIVAGETTTTTLHLTRLEYWTVKFFNGTTEVKSDQVSNGYTVAKPAAPAESEGHTFSGWSTQPPDATSRPLFSFNTQITADTNLYAVWDAIEYTITYVSEAQPVASDTYTTDAPFTLPTPTNSVFTFRGWYAEEDFSGTRVYSLSAGNTGNVTYYAKWTVPVHLVPNNSTDSATPYDVIYNKTFNESVPDPIPTSMATGLTKTGSESYEWYKTDSAILPSTWPATAYDKTAPITEEIYLQAKWQLYKNFSGTVTEFLAAEFDDTSSSPAYTISISGVTDSNFSSILTHLQEYSTFSYNLTLTGTLTEIPDNAFNTYSNSSASRMKQISMPDTVTKIGTKAFYNCRSLSLTYPSGVTEIGDWAFPNSESGTISLPSSIQKIGNHAYYEIGGLSIGASSFTLPATVVELYSTSFISDKSFSITFAGTNSWTKWDGSTKVEENVSLTKAAVSSSSSTVYRYTRP